MYRSRMRAWMIGIVALLLISCSVPANEAESATQSGTSVPGPEAVAGEAVSVVVKLPQGDHTKPIDGWVVDSNGSTVAEFRFEAAVLYERIGEGYGAQDYDTTVTQAPLQLAVELPGPGAYQFHVGAVEYFGGCGTCGRFHEDGGSVEATIEDGSVIYLDVGQATAVS